MQRSYRRINDLFGDRLLIASFAFLLLSLVVMPLDSEKHARAEHENLERKEDYRDPIHNFQYFRALLGSVYCCESRLNARLR